MHARNGMLATVFLFACGGSSSGGDSATPGDAASFCTELAQSNDGCWSDDLDGECLERYAECGDGMAVLESCPVQLSCS